MLEISSRLRGEGVVLLRAAFARGPLASLRAAAIRCFDSIEAAKDPSVPAHYQFNRLSHSVTLPALLDFGCAGSEELMAPLASAGLDQLIHEAMDGELVCRMEQSWVRRKPAPCQTPAQQHFHSWHQDGGLGVRFPAEAGPVIPMTRLLTCWLPLGPCGQDAPGLEFVRRRLESLLHFTELDDRNLRRRFAPEEFWAPELELGDGLVFLNGTLHRTYHHAGMRRERLSVEYRFFPPDINSGSGPEENQPIPR
ncbi:MAG TPA: hypothetical protein VLY04_12150 [Bryobacteraceae bacterium]|nr:hypothetical protein [Bryobacteraceae bacterium]